MVMIFITARPIAFTRDFLAQRRQDAKKKDISWQDLSREMRAQQDFILYSSFILPPSSFKSR